MILAQTLQMSRKNDPMTFWEQLSSWKMPSQAEWADGLVELNVAIALVLIVFGLVYMLQGWKIFKMLVIVNAAALGGMLGARLGALVEGGNVPLFAGIGGALLLAILAWPLMKLAVSLMGALAGSFLGYVLWSYIAMAAGHGDVAQYAWAGALIGLVTLGLLALVIFRWVVMIFTSLQGALMVVSGILAVLMRLPAVRDPLLPELGSNRHLLALLIGVPSVIALAFQATASGKKLAKKKPES